MSSCAVCGERPAAAGVVRGKLVQRDFHLERCASCGYARVVDPVDDLAAVYSMDYYEGRGADPLVDYMTELREPERTVRRYEWSGIVEAVGAHKPIGSGTRWLDFGCGNGGLVRYVDGHLDCEIVGWDEGEIVGVARRDGIRIVEDSELDALGPFDIVTAIEVLEHVPDPVETINRIAELMAPGGVFFYTTGNAAPYDELTDWAYVIPEIHISFYEPRTLERLLGAAGLDAVRPGTAGWHQIYRYKILKNLRRRYRNRLTDMVPVGPFARFFERRRRLAAFPLGLKPQARSSAAKN